MFFGLKEHASRSLWGQFIGGIPQKMNYLPWRAHGEFSALRVRPLGRPLGLLRDLEQPAGLSRLRMSRESLSQNELVRFGSLEIAQMRSETWNLGAV